MSNQNSDNTLVIVGIVGGVLLLGFLAVGALSVGAVFFLNVSRAPARMNPPPTTTVTSSSSDAVDSVIKGPERASKLPTLPQPDDSPVIAPVPTSAVDPEDSATSEPPQTPTSGT